MKSTKILLLFSGGLDSLLCLKILENKGSKVTPVCFSSYFFDCEKSLKIIKQTGFKLKIVNISEDHLKIVKKPIHGRGGGMNPCIDCHLLMLKKAKQIMEKEKYDFIATGEVLGQRPFSQSRQSLELIEKKAKLQGVIIRPLSAKLLKETKFGQEGLYDISGKDRKKQIELAKIFKIKEIPTPGGGCILTDANFSYKLKELFKRKKNFNGDDIQLLKLGRTFFYDTFFIVVSRNEKEGIKLKENRKRGDIVIEPNNFPGPAILIRKIKKSSQEEMINCGSDLIIMFSKKIPENPILSFL